MRLRNKASWPRSHRLPCRSSKCRRGRRTGRIGRLCSSRPPCIGQRSTPARHRTDRRSYTLRKRRSRCTPHRPRRVAPGNTRHAGTTHRSRPSPGRTARRACRTDRRSGGRQCPLGSRPHHNQRRCSIRQRHRRRHSTPRRPHRWPSTGTRRRARAYAGVYAGVSSDRGRRHSRSARARREQLRRRPHGSAGPLHSRRQWRTCRSAPSSRPDPMSSRRCDSRPPDDTTRHNTPRPNRRRRRRRTVGSGDPRTRARRTRWKSSSCP
jgi:hypothetical protein